MSSESQDQSELQRAYSRARSSATFTASLVAAWERAFGGTFAGALGAGDEAIIALGLCLRPRDDHWVADIEEIAAETDLDPAKLGSLLRQASVAEKLANSPPISNVVDGRLLAARDREDPEQQ
jgi:hypothetical protein